MTNMWEAVPRLLARHTYLVLATADAEGRPWATPVFYAARHEHLFLWVSAPDSRHSRNIAERPTVAMTIFDSHAPIGGAEALYLEATATRVEDGDRATALDTLNARLPARHRLAMADVEVPGPLQVYRADVSRHFVLIRGGDQRFDNVTDMRLEVTPPG
jgi:nitroimidazol reductase NimA-like FMN-containing flavoprotein (pyridoxamine 5'-phosphate oxidase superfamily)